MRRLPKKSKHAVVTAIACGLALLFALLSPLAMEGARRGLRLCGEVLVPSLFPFFVLSSFLARREALPGGRRFCKFFQLPPEAFSVILMGLLGGFPVGARLSAQLLCERRLTAAQARRLQLFCINAGPGYLIGAVGNGLLGNRTAGLLLFCSLTLSALLLGVVTRFLPELPCPEPIPPEPDPPLNPEFSAMTVRAMTEGMTALLHVCGWVVLCSALCELFRLLPLEIWSAIGPLNVLLELSSGIMAVIQANLPLPVLCAALGWGGLSVHLQILPDLRATGLRFRLFWAARLLHGSLAAAICAGLSPLFRRAVTPVIQQSHVTPQVRAFAISAPTAAALLLFCAFLILDAEFPHKTPKHQEVSVPKLSKINNPSPKIPKPARKPSANFWEINRHI